MKSADEKRPALIVFPTCGGVKPHLRYWVEQAVAQAYVVLVPDMCLERAPKYKAAGAPLEWHVYPDATHGWDAREQHGSTRRVWNGEMVTYFHSQEVTEDSRKRLFDFLARHAK